MDSSTWYRHTRDVLELLSYFSEVAIAVAAFWGLKQLTIAKQIARENAKREAFKLAAEECRYFAHEVVPLRKPLDDVVKNNKLLSFTKRTFTVEKGELKNHNFDLALLVQEYPVMAQELISYLNAMEAFAIFFASGVAAEEIGYRETGTTFCNAVRQYMAAIFVMRHVNIRYESIVRLFEIWSGRQDAEKISTQIKTLEAAAKRLPKETIKPIGT